MLEPPLVDVPLLVDVPDEVEVDVLLDVLVGVATPDDATPALEYSTSVEGKATVDDTVTKVCPAAGGGTRF